MKITVLGSGSAYSDSHRFNSCYLVEASDDRFLLDCGSDALRALQNADVDPSSIQKIFITHMHADHCGGLPAVLTAMHVLGRKEPIEVYIPFTQLDFVSLWLDNFFIFNDRMSFKISLLPLAGGEIKLSDCVRLEFVQTNHLVKYMELSKAAGINPVSFSVVVREEGKKFFFSSDLDSLDEVKSHIRDSVSLIEATHPSLDEIAALAGERSGVLYFTHIPMELENDGEWRKKLSLEFGIQKLNLVQDGQVLTL
ncbi:MAG: ribonuclease Z [Bacteroidetes bacterium]|nr:ribonuclease Z [Bacteroidota bacterium]